MVDFVRQGDKTYFLGYSTSGNTTLNGLFFPSIGNNAYLIAQGFRPISMDFINSTTGWAAGSRIYGSTASSIYKTTNGGQTWQPMGFSPSVTLSLLKIDFLDESLGFVCGEGGIVYRTNDGGQTWTNCAPFYGVFKDVKIRNVNQVYLVGVKNNKDYILRSNDTGNSWDTLFSGNNLQLKNLEFLDNYIICGGFNVLVFSEDGQNFIQDNSVISNLCYNSASIFKNSIGETFIYFAASTCVTAGTTRIFKKNCTYPVAWEIQPCPSTRYLLQSHFIDNLTGWAVSTASPSEIIKTNNGGQQWDIIHSSTSESFKDIFFINSTTGWVVGANGLILKTINEGESWTIQNSNTTSTILSVYFISEQKGWACGENGLILKTENGGNTWTQISAGTSSKLSSVFFLNEQKGWISTNNAILRTTDGGQSWNTFQFPLTDKKTPHFNDVHFVNQIHGVAVGTYSTIAVTEDGGQNWIKYQLLTADDITAVTFYDHLHGYFVDISSNIYKTFDGGNSWLRLYTGNLTGNGLAFFDIVATDPQNAWALGGYYMTTQQPKILHTNSGGGTPLNLDEKPSLQTLVYPNPFMNNLTIEFVETVSKAEISIINIAGDVVYRENIANMKAYPLKISEAIPPGVYLLHVKSVNSNSLIKLVKL